MQPHGTMRLEWAQDTLNIHVVGPLNIEAAVKFREMLYASINNRSNTSWKRLVVFCPQVLGGPDVVRTINELRDWLAANGCRACAVVLRTAPQKMFYRDVDTTTKFFSNESDAVSWLSLQ